MNLILRNGDISNSGSIMVVIWTLSVREVSQLRGGHSAEVFLDIVRYSVTC